MTTELTAIQQRRVSLIELVADVNDVGVGAVHCVLQESQAVIQFAPADIVMVAR